MFNTLIVLLFISVGFNSFAQQIEWITTSRTEPWKVNKYIAASSASARPDVTISLNDRRQEIQGFGACFNELGWTSLEKLAERDRFEILQELFAPNFGGNFTICRMPVGANDFSTEWYSYDETPGDFELKNFSISHDLKTLLPFIQSAKIHNPDLKIWASPWSPPAWMKYNKHYGCAVVSPELDKQFDNGLKLEQRGKEGTNMFVQEDAYFKTYAGYFSKFIDAYRNEGIRISMVMPQNEFNSCQIFPSCTWTSAGLAKFIGTYLGPEMKKRNVELMFGTMERPDVKLIDTILTDAKAQHYVRGIGFQWGGKNAIAATHQKYPEIQLYQSEQECGDGKNDWNYCVYAWSLMKHYLEGGANAYMYWNISLEKGGFSRWGWQQNSLVTVDPVSKMYRLNHEYYLLKHVSHFVKPGAYLLETRGVFSDLLAFINPDNSVILVLHNEKTDSQNVTLTIEGKQYLVLLPADSFSTLKIN